MGPRYLVRYGRMGHTSRFGAVPGLGALERGQVVVVRTARGTELGEVLTPVVASGTSPEEPRILRTAGPDDLGRCRQADRERPARLSACAAVFDDGAWPLLLVDVEPLLDDGRTVLYYLGPHRLDDAGLRDALRSRCGIDAVLEPVGRDLPDEVEEEPTDNGCGSCGSGGGCGSGGCGASADESSNGHGGCSGCSVKELVRGRKRRAASTA